MITIRPAQPEDISAITLIYNDAILHTTATFDTEEKTEADRRDWLLAHGEKHAVIVAVLEGIVTGWASLSKWSERPAYDATAETSVYVHKDFRKRGIGKELMEVLVLEAQKNGFHSLVARISGGNEHSIYLHERMGFTVIGTLTEVGYKFDRYHDVHILQKVF